MISIIIIVKNDRRIEKLLKKLKIIPKPQKTEIIVVDASEGNLDDIKNKFPKVRWIYFHNKTNKKITIPEQRNLGIRKSKGDIIAFIDADCIPKKRWLIEITKTLISRKEYFVSGLIKTEDYMTIEVPKREYIDYCGNGNLAFRKEIIRKMGYYDENLEVAEDHDICLRAKKKGYKIFFNKKAILIHPRENFKKNIKKGFVYGKGAVRLYKKSLDQIKLNKHFIYTISYSAYILFLPLTFIWHYYPLLILIPAIINFRRNPLKELVNLAYGLGVLKELIFPSNYNNKS